MATQKQLGQLRPSTTSAVSILSPATSSNTVVDIVIICNTSGLPATASIFHDDDGTTYDESTALAWNIEVPADTVISIELYIGMTIHFSNLAVRTSVGNALTFTAYGSE